MADQSQIIIYQTEDNQTQIEVRLVEDTVWLTQKMMAELFQRDKSVISRHINNVFEEGELDSESTVAKFATVQTEGGRSISREIEYFNLDAIISVGYRIKSQIATKFRQWATQRIKEYLVQGYSINQQLLQKKANRLNELSDAIKMISSISKSEFLDTTQIDSFLNLLERYSNALNILDDYDYQRKQILNGTKDQVYLLSYSEVSDIIDKMRTSIGNSELFGKEKDESMKSSISTIYQTFDGIELYPTLEEKAANLLYFLVKNHSFVDGNKRIAAALFLYFLDKNRILNSIELDNDLLVALTLMIATSNPHDKELIINIVALLLQGKR